MSDSGSVKSDDTTSSVSLPSDDLSAVLSREYCLVDILGASDLLDLISFNFPDEALSQVSEYVSLPSVAKELVERMVTLPPDLPSPSERDTPVPTPRPRTGDPARSSTEWSPPQAVPASDSVSPPSLTSESANANANANANAAGAGAGSALRGVDELDEFGTTDTSFDTGLAPMVEDVAPEFAYSRYKTQYLCCRLLMCPHVGDLLLARMCVSASTNGPMFQFESAWDALFAVFRHPPPVNPIILNYAAAILARVVDISKSRFTPMLKRLTGVVTPLLLHVSHPQIAEFVCAVMQTNREHSAVDAADANEFVQSFLGGIVGLMERLVAGDVPDCTGDSSVVAFDGLVDVLRCVVSDALLPEPPAVTGLTLKLSMTHTRPSTPSVSNHLYSLAVRCLASHPTLGPRLVAVTDAAASYSSPFLPDVPKAVNVIAAAVACNHCGCSFSTDLCRFRQPPADSGGGGGGGSGGGNGAAPSTAPILPFVSALCSHIPTWTRAITSEVDAAGDPDVSIVSANRMRCVAALVGTTCKASDAAVSASQMLPAAVACILSPGCNDDARAAAFSLCSAVIMRGMARPDATLFAAGLGRPIPQPSVVTLPPQAMPPPRPSPASSAASSVSASRSAIPDSGGGGAGGGGGGGGGTAAPPTYPPDDTLGRLLVASPQGLASQLLGLIAPADVCGQPGCPVAHQHSVSPSMTPLPSLTSGSKAASLRRRRNRTRPAFRAATQSVSAYAMRLAVLLKMCANWPAWRGGTARWTVSDCRWHPFLDGPVAVVASVWRPAVVLGPQSSRPPSSDVGNDSLFDLWELEDADLLLAGGSDDTPFANVPEADDVGGDGDDPMRQRFKGTFELDKAKMVFRGLSEDDILGEQSSEAVDEEEDVALAAQKMLLGSGALSPPAVVEEEEEEAKDAQDDGADEVADELAASGGKLEEVDDVVVVDDVNSPTTNGDCVTSALVDDGKVEEVEEEAKFGSDSLELSGDVDGLMDEDDVAAEVSIEAEDVMASMDPRLGMSNSLVSPLGQMYDSSERQLMSMLSSPEQN